MRTRIQSMFAFLAVAGIPAVAQIPAEEPGPGTLKDGQHLQTPPARKEPLSWFWSSNGVPKPNGVGGVCDSGMIWVRMDSREGRTEYALVQPGDPPKETARIRLGVDEEAIDLVETGIVIEDAGKWAMASVPDGSRKWEMNPRGRTYVPYNGTRAVILSKEERVFQILDLTTGKILWEGAINTGLVSITGHDLITVFNSALSQVTCHEMASGKIVWTDAALPSDGKTATAKAMKFQGGSWALMIADLLIDPKNGKRIHQGPVLDLTESEVLVVSGGLHRYGVEKKSRESGKTEWMFDDLESDAVDGVLIGDSAIVLTKMGRLYGLGSGGQKTWEFKLQEIGLPRVTELTEVVRRIETTAPKGEDLVVLFSFEPPTKRLHGFVVLEPKSGQVRTSVIDDSGDSLFRKDPRLEFLNLHEGWLVGYEHREIRFTREDERLVVYDLTGKRGGAEGTEVSTSRLKAYLCPGCKERVEGIPGTTAKCPRCGKQMKFEDPDKDPWAGTPTSSYAGRIQRRQEPARGESSESAVVAALRWLARHQSADGHWGCRDFSNDCNRVVREGGKCGGAGYEEYDTGVTSLSLLAFFGAGYTHLSKDTYDGICFGTVVKNGVQWLIGVQSPDGAVTGKSSAKYMYNHCIATLALAEAYGMSGSPALREKAQKAVDYLVKAQNPYKAWRYTEKSGDNDTSVTAWAVSALKAAEAAGLKVPNEGYAGAKAWLDEATGDDYRVGYTERGTGKVAVQGQNEKFDHHEALTAVGIMARILIDKNHNDPCLFGGAKLIVADLPEWDGWKIDYYYWHHGSMALYLLDGPSGPFWKAWNEKMKAALVTHQKTRKDGCANGSWDTAERWSFERGRVYATAINALTLETSYRYPSSGTPNK